MELPSKETRQGPRAQREAPGGKQGCGTQRTQLPKAKFNFTDLAGGDGVGTSGAQGEGRKAQVGMLVPTACKQSSGRPARAGSRVCMASLLSLDSPKSAVTPWHGLVTPGVRSDGRSQAPGPGLSVRLPLLAVSFGRKVSPPWVHSQHLPQTSQR